MNDQLQKHSLTYQINHLFSGLKIGPKGLVLILILFSFATRLHNLDDQNLWGDELWSYYRASQSTLSNLYNEIKQANQAPLFETLILRPWLRLGQNEFWYRLPSVFISVLSVSILYPLGKKTLGLKTSSLAIMFLVISPLHVYYSREMRAYMLFALLATLCVYSLFMALQKKNGFWWAYILSGTLLLYTHYHAVFILISLGILACFEIVRNHELRLLKQITGVHLGILLLFLPWLPTFLAQYSTGAVNWIPPTDTISSFTQLVGFFFAWHWVMPEWFLEGAGWLLWVTLALGFTHQYKHKQQAHYGYVAGFVFLNAFIIFAVSFYKPLAFPRYFIGMLPSACLAIAFTVVNYRSRVVTAVLTVLLVGLSLFSTYHVLTYRWTANWRELSEYLATEVATGDLLLMFPPQGGGTVPFTYYDESKIEVHYSIADIANQSQVVDALTALPPHSRVWVVQGTQYTDLESLDGVLASSYPNHQLFIERRFDEAVADEQLVLYLWLYTYEP